MAQEADVIVDGIGVTAKDDKSGYFFGQIIIDHGKAHMKIGQEEVFGPVPHEPFSFGGWSESSFGVGDIRGKGSIEFWKQSKKQATKWNREAGANWAR